VKPERDSTRARSPKDVDSLLPGHEFSGEVAAVGDGVMGMAVGSPVYGLNDWFRDGALAEYCAALDAEVAPKPRSVDHLAAAVSPISVLTAWQGLIERAHLIAGERVLVDSLARARPAPSYTAWLGFLVRSMRGR
jgi:NADPH:quinone reductase-like Zn-dependent oxidoreductase